MQRSLRHLLAAAALVIGAAALLVASAPQPGAARPLSPAEEQTRFVVFELFKPGGAVT